MKSLMTWNILTASLAALFVVGFQNCSPKNFGSSAGNANGSASASGGTGGTTTPGSTTPGSTSSTNPGSTTPGTDSGNSTSSNPIPTPTPYALYMTLYTPSCSSYTACLATFTLTNAQGQATPLTQTLTFDWMTDDTKGQPGNGFAVSNVNYTPNHNTCTFKPGDTACSLYVQSLAIDNTLKIPFMWTNVYFGGVHVPPPQLVGYH
jgi:hypothetical protein